MKPKPEPEFSWNLLFGVTAASFFSFSLLVRLLNGNPEHSRLFSHIAIVSSVMLLLSVLAGALVNSTVPGDE